MSFSEFVREEQRLVLLMSLHEMPRYQSNSSLLTTTMERFGLPMSRDQVHTELNWLQEQGCVTLQEAGSVVVATLTNRGADAVTGMAKIHGIKRPSPR